MNTSKRTHPSQSLLEAFAQGRLTGAEFDELERHVAECDDCCRALRDVPESTLLEQPRQNQPVSDETIAFDESSVTKADEDENTAVPAELVDHPRYRVIKRLGAGGMGDVYQAEHRLMERPVALKVINQGLVSSKKAIERFRLEVRAAAKLSHRNIVTAHDADQAEALHFLVMEYVAGESLDQTVKRRGPLPVRHACNYIVQVAQGLQHAWEHGMVHRDIKPHNLMRTAKGTIKILDFGLARLASEADASETARLTHAGATLGTTDYIAPEQVEDAHNVDIRADIYSLGCTLYFLLTGRVPFPKGSQVDKLVARLKEQPQPITDHRQDLPAEVVRIVERMMEKEPAKRLQSPEEVIEVLMPLARKADLQPSATVSAVQKELPTTRPVQIEATQEMQSPVGQTAAGEPEPVDQPPVSQELDLANLPIEELTPQLPGVTGMTNQRRPTFDLPKWLRRHRRGLALAAGGLLLICGLVAAYSLVRDRWPAGVAEQQDGLNRRSMDGTESPGDEGAEPGSPENAVFKEAATAPQPQAPRTTMLRDGPTALYVLPQRNLWWPDFDPPRDALERAGVRVVVASSAMKDVRAGQNAAQVDLLLRNADPADYDMVLFGGSPNPDRNMEFVNDSGHLQTAADFINAMLRDGKYVATVCNGTAVLAESGCLDGLRAARSGHLHLIEERHPEVTWVDQPLVQSSDNILTAGSDHQARQLFNERIVSLLRNK